MKYAKILIYTDPLLGPLNVVKIEDMFKVKIFKFYYKLSYVLLPKYFILYIHKLEEEPYLCLMVPCAIALQELINICCLYSIEINLNFNATKFYCMMFTPRNYELFIPSLYLNKIACFVY